MARGGCGNEVMVICRVLAAALGVAPSHAQQDSAKMIAAASLNEVMVVCRVLVAAYGCGAIVRATGFRKNDSNSFFAENALSPHLTVMRHAPK